MSIQGKDTKIILIGGGIMSATLGVLMKQLMPKANINLYERLDKVGSESSAAWNNAGTGHSAFCELNYTPILENGEIDISKALKIAESFEISKQFWSYLKENGHLDMKESFINDVDHMSFVMGEENVAFLKKRYETMIKYGIFDDMEYSEDTDKITSWIPLLMNGRDRSEPVAATKMEIGTDVNFGNLTQGMIRYLEGQELVNINLAHEIKEIKRDKSGTWEVKVENITTHKSRKEYADFVFIGAGGGSLILLEKSGIPEAKGYGGFPISGQWLRCNNQEVIEKHEAKVYGKAEVGSPPMSVPHLDTRIINGEKCLLFGPYAGFSSKFLKNGSYLDLFLSVEMHNVWPMLSAGRKNIDLTKYLIKQVVQSDEDRFEALKKYYPEAKMEDWELEIAGQRVQIIKKDEHEGGVLKFGTEIVTCEDKTIAALLGASPGASTSVSIMLDLLQQCFPSEIESREWQKKLQEMIPSYGISLIENADFCKKIRKQTTDILKLENGIELN